MLLTKNKIFLISVILIALVTIEIIAEVLLKKYVTTPKLQWLLIGVLLYLCVPFLFLALLKQSDNLIIANTLWQVSNLFFVAIFGYVLFKENLSIAQWSGVALSIVVVILLMIEPKT